MAVFGEQLDQIIVIIIEIIRPDLGCGVAAAGRFAVIGLNFVTLDVGIIVIGRTGSQILLCLLIQVVFHPALNSPHRNFCITGAFFHPESAAVEKGFQIIARLPCILNRSALWIDVSIPNQIINRIERHAHFSNQHMQAFNGFRMPVHIRPFQPEIAFGPVFAQRKVGRSRLGSGTRRQSAVNIHIFINVHLHSKSKTNHALGLSFLLDTIFFLLGLVKSKTEIAKEFDLLRPFQSIWNLKSLFIGRGRFDLLVLLNLFLFQLNQLVLDFLHRLILILHLLAKVINLITSYQAAQSCNTSNCH